MPRGSPRDKSGSHRRSSHGRRSWICDDDRYVPGDAGMVEIRARNAACVLRENPYLEESIGAHPASAVFHEQQLLRYRDKLTDGFRARYTQEVLLVDSGSDSALRGAVEQTSLEVAGSIDPANCRRLSVYARPVHQEEAIKMAAEVVVRVFGGADNRFLQQRFRRRLENLRSPPPNDLHIGKLMGGDIISDKTPGCGLCRHRAILFKYLCDELRLAPCALVVGVAVTTGVKDLHKERVDGNNIDHMWNIVKLGDKSVLVDLMLRPGMLLDALDLEDLASGKMPMDRLRLAKEREEVAAADPKPDMEEEEEREEEDDEWSEPEGGYGYHRIGGRAGLSSLHTASQWSLSCRISSMNRQDSEEAKVVL